MPMNSVGYFDHCFLWRMFAENFDTLEVSHEEAAAHCGFYIYI